jgi:hypothetical protein
MVQLRLVVGKKRKDSNQKLDFDQVRTPRSLSVNVGLPRDVTWNGKTVRTAVWLITLLTCHKGRPDRERTRMLFAGKWGVTLDL